jgi:hypothetical protein
MRDPSDIVVAALLGALFATFAYGMGGAFEARENAHRAWCVTQNAQFMTTRSERGERADWCVPNDSGRAAWRVP